MSSQQSGAGRDHNDFSGRAESVVQVGRLSGDVILRPGRQLPVPSQLPAAPSHFVDREEGMRVMTDYLAGGQDAAAPGPGSPRIAAITGQPGVGKTAFAVRWAHEHQREFPDGALFIDLRAYSPDIAVSASAALESFIRAFDISPDVIPEDSERRAALFRSLVRNRRMLIVVDNAGDSAQVRALLPASSTCPVVVTSRSELSGLAIREGAVRVNLDVLSPEKSVELLLLLAGNQRRPADEAAVRRVAGLCGYLPLALRLAGERAASRPGASFAELADEIVSEQHRLDELAAAEDELSDTRAVFSWSYRALPPDLQRAFRMIGLHAGPDLRAGPAGALLGAGERTAGQDLRSLARLSLLREISPGAFRMHDLLRLYARELAMRQETQADRTLAVRRELTWYLLTCDIARKAVLPYSVGVGLVPGASLEVIDDFADGPRAMGWFATERHNIMAALRQCGELGQYDIGWKLAVLISGLLELGSFWDDWESAQLSGLQASRVVEDSQGEALSLQLLGDVAWRSGALTDAEGRYAQSLEISRGLGMTQIEAFALRGLGLIAREQDRAADAVRLFGQALELFRQLGFRRGEGMTLASLGKCALDAGDVRESIARTEQAISALHDIGDEWSVAWVRLDLAASLERAGRDEQAADVLSRAVLTFTDHEDRRCAASGLIALGRIYAKAGDRSRARATWTEGLRLLEQVDGADLGELRQLLDGVPPDSP